MTTVQPAKRTARPEVAIASDDRVVAAAVPVVEALAVAGDDEEGVVDPDADADHRRQLGAERRDDEDRG